MKLLLDACVWPGAVAELARSGHDVVWAGDWAESPSDDEVLARALSEGRVVVTLDKDFGNWLSRLVTTTVGSSVSSTSSFQNMLRFAARR